MPTQHEAKSMVVSSCDLSNWEEETRQEFKATLSNMVSQKPELPGTLAEKVQRGKGERQKKEWREGGRERRREGEEGVRRTV